MAWAKIVALGQFEARYQRLSVLVAEMKGTAVTPIAAVAGWVSSEARSMASSATVNLVFDLGPDWSFYSLIQDSWVPGNSA